MKDKSSLRYFWVTLLNIIITIAEFIGGAISGSLALLSDAVHNLSDVGSIVLAFVANLISKRKRNTSKTFGYDRAEILAAFTNGIILIVISIYLFIEGIQRFSHPEPIRGMIMLIVSLIGLAANVISMFVVMKEAKTSLNAKATFLNMLSDSLFKGFNRILINFSTIFLQIVARLLSFFSHMIFNVRPIVFSKIFKLITSFLLIIF